MVPLSNTFRGSYGCVLWSLRLLSFPKYNGSLQFWITTSEINGVWLIKSITQAAYFQNKPRRQASLSLSAVSFYQNSKGTEWSCCYKCLAKSEWWLL